MVVHLGLDMNGGGGIRTLEVGIDKGPKRCHTDGCRLQQPCITVDACTLVEPAFLERGIGTDTDEVVAAIVHIFRHIVYLRGVAAGFHTEPESVEPYVSISENTVELQGYMLAEIFCRDADYLTIPADTGLWVLIAYGLITMRMAGERVVWQCGHPVVGDAHLLPCGIIKLRCVGPLVVDGVSLGQIVEILSAAAKVLLRVGSIAKGKFPPLTEADSLPDALCLCITYFL